MPRVPQLALLPLLCFLLLVLGRWMLVPAEGAAAWLDRAEAVRGVLATEGGTVWGALDPLEDPRVGPTAALLSLGLSGAAILWIWRLLALAAGGLAIARLSRGPRGGGGVGHLGAWILACAPLWLERASLADPHLALGVLLLLLADRALPLGVAAVGLAWGLGWSPWAWIALPWAVLGRAPHGGGARSRGWAALPVGLLLSGILNPPALLAPAAWWRAMLWQAELQGIGVATGAAGVAVGWWPLTGTLSVATLLLGWAARHWPARLRGGDLTPVALALVVLLAARSGFSQLAGLLIVLPWAAREAAAAAGELLASRRRPGARVRWTVALVALALAPMVWVYGGRLLRDSARGEPGGAAAMTWVAREARPGARIAYESGLRPPEEGEQHWLAIPFHSREPGLHRGAYWSGWYAGFDRIVIREERVVRFLRERERYPDFLRFYLAIKSRARGEEVFGPEPGRRVRVLHLVPAPDPLAPGWRARVAGGAPSGLQAGFLGNLGALLARSGDAAAAVELLEEAQAAGYDEPGIYLNLAAALLEEERIFAAGRVLDEALQRYPDSPELLYNLGLTAVRAKLWDRAARTLRRLRIHWPHSAEAAYLLGYALAGEGRTEEARRELEAAFELGLPPEEERKARELLQSLGVDAHSR